MPWNTLDVLYGHSGFKVPAITPPATKGRITCSWQSHLT